MRRLTNYFGVGSRGIPSVGVVATASECLDGLVPHHRNFVTTVPPSQPRKPVEAPVAEQRQVRPPLDAATTAVPVASSSSLSPVSFMRILRHSWAFSRSLSDGATVPTAISNAAPHSDRSSNTTAASSSYSASSSLPSSTTLSPAVLARGIKNISLSRNARPSLEPDPIPVATCPMSNEPLVTNAGAGSLDARRRRRLRQNQLIRDATDARDFLEKSDEHRIQLLLAMTSQTRRSCVVLAGTLEWYDDADGKRGSEEMVRADSDRDNSIGSEDLLLWVRHAVDARTRISRTDLCRIACIAAVPFIAFGTLDNSLMLLAGDAIDSTIGQRFGLSVMGAAACGAIFSGSIGMQFHGVAKRVATRVFGLVPPTLTAIQWKQKSVSRVQHIGETLGVMIGLLLGMFPLLFIDTEAKRQQQQLKEDVTAIVDASK